MMRKAQKWIVDIAREASGFDEKYYGKLLGKAWNEVAFVFERNLREK